MPHPSPPARSRRRAATLVVVASLTAGGLAQTMPASAGDASLAVEWTRTSVVSGGTSRAIVDPASLPTQSAQVVLQRRFPDAWRTVDATAKQTRRGLVLRVPTDQYARLTLRAVAKEAGEVVATSATRVVRVRTGYDPLGRPRQHVRTTGGDGHPLRWDSCQTIRWRFHRSHAPARGLRQVKAGFRRVHQATGLEFDYVGTTTRKPNPYGNGLRGAEVIVGWRTPADYETFAENPRVVGVGGSTFGYGWQEADGFRVARATRGGVVLNAAARLRPGFGRGLTWGEVVVHELGHVVGLSHTGADRQIMYAYTTRRDARWGAGDLTGLRRVGDTRGCLTQVSGRRDDRWGRTASW